MFREYVEWFFDPKNRKTVLQGLAIGILLRIYLEEE